MAYLKANDVRYCLRYPGYLGRSNKRRQSSPRLFQRDVFDGGALVPLCPGVVFRHGGAYVYSP